MTDWVQQGILYKMDNTEKKTKIRAVMIDHLKSKGYPNMTSKAILAELKPMWTKLGTMGLLHPDWTYKQFVDLAHAEEHYANLQAALKEELLNHFSKKTK